MLCVGGLVGEKKQSFLQYVAIFLLLKFHQLIIDFKSMKMSFKFFKVKNTPHKHQKDGRNNALYYHAIHKTLLQNVGAVH